MIEALRNILVLTAVIVISFLISAIVSIIKYEKNNRILKKKLNKEFDD